MLELTNGNISKAARLSGMHRKSVEYIVRKLDLNVRNLNVKDDEESDSSEL